MARSHVDIGVVLKHMINVAPHPWIGAKLLKLEAEKSLFNLLYPGHRNGRAGKIRQVSIRITDLCNLRCRTCGQWGERGFLLGKEIGALRREEVPPGRYLDLFTDLKKNGHRPLLYLWGGEPTLYKGLPTVMEGATELGLPVSIATNGTNLVEWSLLFARLPLFLVQVSIDGHCRDLHNRLRPSAGRGDGFGQILDGLASLNEAKRRLGRSLPLVASLTVISRDNAGHLVELYERFRDQVDLFVFYLSWWMDEENANRHERDYARRFDRVPSLHRGWIGTWRPDDCVLIEEQLRRIRRRSRRRSSPPVTVIPSIRGVKNLETYYSNHGERFGYDQCVSIFQAVEIDSNGDMSPCRDYHDYVVGSVKERTITDLWNSGAYRRFRRSLATEGLMPVCSRCCGLMGY